jgi:hypothetical protein
MNKHYGDCDYCKHEDSSYCRECEHCDHDYYDHWESQTPETVLFCPLALAHFTKEAIE